MESFILVRPQHLNHFGYLFGGQLLAWVDEMAWLAASADYPGCRFVTRALATVEFCKPVTAGTTLRFICTEKKKGQTSVSYEVSVKGRAPHSHLEKDVFFTIITFVALDDAGNKKVIN